VYVQASRLKTCATSLLIGLQTPRSPVGEYHRMIRISTLLFWIMVIAVILTAIPYLKESVAPSSPITIQQDAPTVAAQPTTLPASPLIFKNLNEIDYTALASRTLDIKSLYKQLENARVHKDDFETDAEYETRLANSYKNLSLNGGSIEDLYAFKLNGMFDGIGSGSYVPEHQYFKKLISEDIGIEQEEVQDDSYIGSNAFGVEKVIHKREKNFYGVHIINRAEVCQSFYPNVSDDPCDLVIPMPKEVAKTATGNGSTMPIVYVFKFIQPYFQASDFHEKPTINSPNELIMHNRDIVGELKAVYVLDTVGEKIVFEKRF
jgi:hypothetical protein